MLNYAIAAENGSMYNTPPCWPIYICGLVFKHLLKLGGLAGLSCFTEAAASVPLTALCCCWRVSHR